MKITIDIDPVSFADMNVCINQLFRAARGHQINIVGMQTLQNVRVQIFQQIRKKI